MAKLVEVTIANSQFTIKTDADEAYIQDIARYLNGKIEEVQKKTKSVSTLNVIILSALNIADDLFRERNKERKYIRDVEDRSKNLIDVIERQI